jgi:hypothetical protein
LLEDIAIENGYHGFTASVLRENTAMIHVFKKRYPHAQSKNLGGGEVHLIMDFKPPGVILK